MRASLVGAGVLAGAWSLACAGPGGDGETPEDAPVPEGAGEGEPAEAGDAEASLLWLAAEDGACALKTQDLPSGEARTLVSLGGACPERWRIAVSRDVPRTIVYSSDHVWVAENGKVYEAGGTKDGIDQIASFGDHIQACGEPDVQPVVDEKGVHKWTLDGKTYEMQPEQSATLARSFLLSTKGWVQGSVEPVALYEGMYPPYCDGISGWYDSADLSPERETEESEFREATEEESAALQALDAGGWYISQQGGIAVRTEWLEGVIFSSPVASRPSPSAAWTVVPELGKGSGGTGYDVSGPFLLINAEDKAVVRDVRTGKDVWSDPGSAIFWREGISLPGLPGEGGAEAPDDAGAEEPGDGVEPGGEEPEPEPGSPPGPRPPTKVKSKVGKGTKVKGKVKAKAPAAQP
jgi:hypothetical protein